MNPPSSTTIRRAGPTRCPTAVRQQVRLGGVGDRAAGVQGEREARTHDAGECGDQHALAEVEFGDRGLLLLGRQFPLFGHSRHAADGDAATLASTPSRTYLPEALAEVWPSVPWKSGGTSVPKTAV